MQPVLFYASANTLPVISKANPLIINFCRFFLNFGENIIFVRELLIYTS